MSGKNISLCAMSRRQCDASRDEGEKEPWLGVPSGPGQQEISAGAERQTQNICPYVAERCPDTSVCRLGQLWRTHVKDRHCRADKELQGLALSLKELTGWIPVLVSCGCCNKLPHTWWLKTTGIYSLTVLEVRVQNRYHWADIKKGGAPSENSRGPSLSCIFSLS